MIYFMKNQPEYTSVPSIFYLRILRGEGLKGSPGRLVLGRGFSNNNKEIKQIIVKTITL